MKISNAKTAGRSFFNGTHYIGRYAATTDTPTRMNAVFTYDGMQKGGYGIREGRGGVGQLLSGTNPQRIDDGYATSAVFYTLKGGSSAQDWVWQHQIQVLKDLAGIELSKSHSTTWNESPCFVRPGYYEVTPDHQLWLSKNAITQLKARFNPDKEYEAEKQLEEAGDGFALIHNYHY
ncbi:hypothetical protein AAF712_015844 [Marasmius tenuissimus]|uniref:Uncharacterized protein n=1 Tax=Marasmius tenuissimus TaxID=585030 RepID=A0ABR2Z9R4_9AGAR